MCSWKTLFDFSAFGSTIAKFWNHDLFFPLYLQVTYKNVINWQNVFSVRALWFSSSLRKLSVGFIKIVKSKPTSGSFHHTAMVFANVKALRAKGHYGIRAVLGFASHGPVLLLKPLPSGITCHITSFRPYPSPTSKGLQVAIGQLFRPLCLSYITETYCRPLHQGVRRAWQILSRVGFYWACSHGLQHWWHSLQKICTWNSHTCSPH